MTFLLYQNVPRKLNFAFSSENFAESPPEITIRTSIIVCLIPQHFSFFKNYTLLILKLEPAVSLASAKTISVLTQITAHDEDGGE